MTPKIHYSAYMGKKAMFAQYIVVNSEDFFVRQVFLLKKRTESPILNQVDLI